MSRAASSGSIGCSMGTTLVIKIRIRFEMIEVQRLGCQNRAA
jgi:hypothetical protein